MHGRPRATKDLDVWIEASTDNSVKVMDARRVFGAQLGDLQARDFEMPGTGFMMGIPPRRIDVLTKIDGVRFEEAALRAIEASFDGVPTKVIGLEDLLANKRASGRLQDLADVRALERLREPR